MWRVCLAYTIMDIIVESWHAQEAIIVWDEFYSEMQRVIYSTLFIIIIIKNIHTLNIYSVKIF